MNAGTVDELFTRELRDDRIGLVDATGREYDYHWLCTSSWQAGNFLRHAGVREDVTVGVVGDGPLALLAFFGTTLLEGTTRFEPPTDLADADDFRALVAPVSALLRSTTSRGAHSASATARNPTRRTSTTSTPASGPKTRRFRRWLSIPRRRS